MSDKRRKMFLLSIVKAFQKQEKAIEEQRKIQFEAFAVFGMGWSTNVNTSNTNSINWGFISKRSRKSRSPLSKKSIEKA